MRINIPYISYQIKLIEVTTPNAAVCWFADVRPAAVDQSN